MTKAETRSATTAATEIEIAAGTATVTRTATAPGNTPGDAIAPDPHTENTADAATDPRATTITAAADATDQEAAATRPATATTVPAAQAAGRDAEAPTAHDAVPTPLDRTAGTAGPQDPQVGHTDHTLTAPDVLRADVAQTMESLYVSSNRHRPDLATGILAPAIDMMIPNAVRRVFAKGLKTHVPFTNLTDAHCQLDHVMMAQEQRTVRISAGGNAITSAPDLPSSDPDEMRLTFIEWLQAYKRFLALIAEYQPKNLLAWNQHHAIIFAHTLRDSHWALVLRYDIELRKCSCHSAIDVTMFQQHIFDDLREKSRDKAAHLTSHAPQAALPKTFRPYQPPNTTSPLPTYRKDHPPSYRATNNFTTIPATPNTQPPPPLRDHGKCFRCGFKGHGARRCPNETMPNGHPVIITKGAKNSWLLDGKPFCYKFNNPTCHTPAPYAAPQNTAPKLAAHDPRKVSCLLPHDVWEAELRALGLWEDFKDIPPSLRDGFNIGAAGPATETYVPENHKSAWDCPSVIQNHIDTEVAAGRYTGPFNQSTLHSLIGPFRTAPLGVTEKPSAPSKFRVIQDFSYPRDTNPSASLNAQIDTTRYTCQWGYFHDVAKAVALAPPGSKAATFD
ncbi:hypothetical protein FRC06_007184, partial [Ceratobasidium sp. 370]